MSKKRKRTRKEPIPENGNKRPKPAGAGSIHGKVLKMTFLSQYYLRVQTLREYLLSKLSTSSNIRRKKILAIKPRSPGHRSDELDSDYFSLANHLDQTLIGVQEEEAFEDDRWKQWTYFSQRAEVSGSTVRSGEGEGDCSQSEIVDFTIWQLVKSSSRLSIRSQHLLCQGFRRDVNFNAINRDENPVSAIPGVISTYPNQNVTMLKCSPWPQVLALMGKEGQKMMIDLILDCGIFIPVETGYGNYLQLSGMPLGDLQILPKSSAGFNVSQPGTRTKRRDAPASGGGESNCLVAHQTPSRISFVRNRILYARAALNTEGNVRYGFRHIHVLNRCRYEAQTAQQELLQLKGQMKSECTENLDDKENRKTIHVMMYMFPREFGLHNVFTSSVDPRETAQPLKDYTLREDEIRAKYGALSGQNVDVAVKVPRRLRTIAKELTKKLRISHNRCSYKKLLDHYCTPVTYPIVSALSSPEGVHDGSTMFRTQIDASTQNIGQYSAASIFSSTKLPSRQPTLMYYATPKAQVTAFCCSVLSTIIPNEFWGQADTQKHNKRCLAKIVDRFITMRRFETVSLHDVVQGMKIQDISWLGLRYETTGRKSQTDSKKRLDLFLEFVYYVFDSLLIPLIRSHFFVTESNIHRYRIFYFRQDLWRSLCEPQLINLKHSMLEEMSIENAQKVLNSRTLGFSHLRLLPKEKGVRPIMNLKRRPSKKGDKKMLGSSINSVLAPVHNMYTYEKNINPDRLGATIFSIGDLYSRLKAFNKTLGDLEEPLFFAKVDVQSAFDTIPQSAVLRVMQNLSSESEYRISKHVEVKPGEGYCMDLDGQHKSKPIRKWVSLATSPNDFQSFKQNVEAVHAVGKKNTVFVENVVNQFRNTNELFNMLSQHVRHNMVKIGKRFYRQKRGIPQGSVLSSILCNYFYADLEIRHLEFLKSPDSLLLRLVDDFLLVTTNRQHAKQFLQIMHDGLPEYGVTVNPLKTLVNFEVSINNTHVTRLVGSRKFPYCGSFIDTKTLNIMKDRERKKDLCIADTLTVEHSKTPGKSFERKSLNAFKIQAHAMFLDTSFNSLSTVFSNIYDSFVETVTKMWRYAKCLPVRKQPRSRLIINYNKYNSITYDHRLKRTGHPVRSAIHKLEIGGLVVGSVTTSEYPLFLLLILLTHVSHTVETIQNLISLAFTLIKSKSNKKKYDGYRCAVTRAQIKWLGLMAFRSVLFKKQAKYRGVLTWLDEQIQALRDKKSKECGPVEGVIGAKRESTDALVRE